MEEQVDPKLQRACDDINQWGFMLSGHIRSETLKPTNLTTRRKSGKLGVLVRQTLLFEDSLLKYAEASGEEEIAKILKEHRRPKQEWLRVLIDMPPQSMGEGFGV